MSEDLYSKPAAGVDKSPGVRRIEAISSCFKKWHKAFLFFFIFLVACE
jgi:SIT family siderophore-iron:H+ symporter-like MFS transporter